MVGFSTTRRNITGNGNGGPYCVWAATQIPCHSSTKPTGESIDQWYFIKWNAAPGEIPFLAAQQQADQRWVPSLGGKTEFKKSGRARSAPLRCEAPRRSLKSLLGRVSGCQTA